MHPCFQRAANAIRDSEAEFTVTWDVGVRPSAMEACHRELSRSWETCTCPWRRETLKGQVLTRWRAHAERRCCSSRGRTKWPEHGAQKFCAPHKITLSSCEELNMQERGKVITFEFWRCLCSTTGMGLQGEEWVPFTPFFHGPLCWFYMKQSSAFNQRFHMRSSSLCPRTWAKSLGRQNVQL